TLESAVILRVFADLRHSGGTVLSSSQDPSGGGASGSLLQRVSGLLDGADGGGGEGHGTDDQITLLRGGMAGLGRPFDVAVDPFWKRRDRDFSLRFLLFVEPLRARADHRLLASNTLPWGLAVRRGVLDLGVQLRPEQHREA